MKNDLIGRIAEVKFETGYNYKLEYLENNKLKWTSLQEKDYGTSEIEDVYINKINDGQYTVNWIESTGISVSHNIDINLKKVWAYMNWNDNSSYGGRSVLTHKGYFKFINNDLSKDNKPFTNLEIVKDFWNRFFNEHDEKAIDDYLDFSYIQHNPYLEDGVESFRKYFVTSFKNELKESCNKIISIHSSKDLVYIHNLSKNNSSDKGRVAVDIFRVKNKKIVEHWDVIQIMPETSLNLHPMF